MRSGAVALLFVLGVYSAESRYYGKRLGALSELHHGVRGTVYAVDARTLFIDGFHYDGEGPAAYFYVGTSKTPSATGATRVRDERGGTGPLRRYRGEGVTLSLPDGQSLPQLRWFSVWCDDFSVNFGDVSIPRDIEYPKPAKVGALRGVHGVSSDPIVVVDAQTLLVPNFSYDGEAPDAKFWVGRGDTPSPQGIRIPDENGKEIPLRKYDKKTIVLTLPGELTVFDIGHFAVWCEAFTVNFGHVPLPRAALANVPPSLKMLGVSPQSRNAALASAPAAAPKQRQKASRHQLARLDATTYRPTLAVGPRARPEHHPPPHATHRRAYNQPPPSHQLLTDDKPHVDVQTSQQIYYQTERTNFYQPELHKQYDDQLDQIQSQQPSQNNQQQYTRHQPNQQDQRQYQLQEDDQYQQYQQQQQIPQDLYTQQQYNPGLQEQKDQYQQQQEQNDQYRQQQQQNDLNDQYKQQQELNDQYRQQQQQKDHYNQQQELNDRYRQQQQQNDDQFKQEQALNDQYRQQQYTQQIHQQNVQYRQPQQPSNQYRQQPQYQQQTEHPYRQQVQQQQQNYQNQQYQNQYSDERAYQRQLNERQLYEQQQLAYERELNERRKAQAQEDDGPFRYRLVPYSFNGARDDV